MRPPAAALANQQLAPPPLLIGVVGWLLQTDGHLMVDKADKNAVLCLSQLAKCYLALGNEAAYKEVQALPAIPCFAPSFLHRVNAGCFLPAQVQAYSAELHREEKWMETATIYPK